MAVGFVAIAPSSPTLEDETVSETPYRTDHRRVTNRGQNLVLMVLLAVLGVFVTVDAWLSDDAYITLRTVDNFIHGLGLTWNPGERVQAYTHPLWMMVLSVFYVLTRDAYYTTIFVSLLLTVVMAWLLVAGVATSFLEGVFALVALALSRSFVDFSTSGLENALTHLLIVCFFAAYFQLRASRRKVFVLSLLVALAMLNRLDVGLLLLPPLVLALSEHRELRMERAPAMLAAILLGFSPLVLWELFSLLYYGYPLPNTYYAKLTTGLPTGDLIKQGLSYFRVSAKADPSSFLVMVGAIPAALLSGKRIHLATLVGIGFYLLYITRIGGDFMVGRFFTAPFLAALIVIVSAGWMTTWKRLAVPLVALAVVGVVAPLSPIWGDRLTKCGYGDVRFAGITNERDCYFEGTGLRMQSSAASTVPIHPNASMGLEIRASLLPVQIMGAIGISSFFAGPDKYIIDLNALADPLLAKIPIPPGKEWRIGHFERLLPAGYIETLLSGQNRICEPNLAQYYDKLRLITRGRLLSSARLDAIWRMNTGQYDPWVESYVADVDNSNKLCNAQSIVDVPFAGGPRLRGYSISSDQIRPGGQVQVILYWQGKPETAGALGSFLHIRNSQKDWPLNPRSGTEMWMQEEHDVPGGRVTSDYWPTQVYADVFSLRLPEDMPVGEYFLEAGWFDQATGEQLEPNATAVKPPLRILWRSILLPSIRVAGE